LIDALIVIQWRNKNVTRSHGVYAPAVAEEIVAVPRSDLLQFGVFVTSSRDKFPDRGRVLYLIRERNIRNVEYTRLFRVAEHATKDNLTAVSRVRAITMAIQIGRERNCVNCRGQSAIV